jgi:hypothetical protein
MAGGPGVRLRMLSKANNASERANYGFSRSDRPSKSRFPANLIDENGGGPGVRLRKRQRAEQSK